MGTIAVFCPTLTGGGAEKVAGLLSRELESYGDKVYFFVLYKKKITYEYGGRLICFDFDKIDERYLRYGRFVVFGRKALAYLYLPKRMREVKRKLGINCTISFLDFPSVLNILSRADDKIIASIRCPKTPQKQQSVEWISKLRTFVYHAMLRKYLNRADGIVSASYGIREDLEQNFGIAEEKSHVIYNFLNQEKINVLKEEKIEAKYKDFFENNFVFICVGRLEKEKNPESVLNSFSQMAQSESNIRLLFVGEGTLRKRLINIAEQKGIQKQVLFISYTQNPYKYMKRSNALILDSFYEGFPNVLVEAMCCGCPPIAVDCFAGPREIIGDITTYMTKINGVKVLPRGILFERGKLHEAMQFVVENPIKLREMGEYGRAYVRQYSNKEIVKQWKKCIGE